MTRRYVIARWVQRKTWFSIEIAQQSCFFLSFLSYRIHFHYVLSYLFGLFGVRTCVSILWHISLLKNATFAWKNSEKPWFWRFLVIFVFLTWRHLWRHCDVIQGMFWFFFGTNGLGRVIAIHLYQTLDVSSIGFRDLKGGGGGIRPPPAVRWVKITRLF